MYNYFKIKRSVQHRERMNSLKNNSFSLQPNDISFRSYDEDDIKFRKDWEAQIGTMESKSYDFDIEAQLPIKKLNINDLKNEGNRKSASQIARESIQSAFDNFVIPVAKQIEELA